MSKKIMNQILSEFKQKKILVTGGTGSVGMGIVKELIKYKPNNIRILSNDENSIFEMRRKFPNQTNLTFMVGDVRDIDRIKLAIRDIDIVFHAAAMKHIDICEQNPFDAVKTNVIGTSNLIEASLLENVSKFVFISTDKATNPSSTLGASKLLAERIIQDAGSYRGLGKTKFSIVRFGNVLGSRGSVFQIFQEQLKTGKSLTITNPKMTRFIMSISDAASLILRVTNIAKDGEIFILKMPSVNILDLGKTMRDVYKTRYPKTRIAPIKTSKVRDKERLHEFLITPSEIPFCHDVGTMYKISKERSKEKISESEFSSETTKKIDQKKLKKIINELLDEY
ncbi:MAG: polysaccharide biosynthesis protein [Nitrosopumilus sp.]|uniref:polysaccharide biosynthesis protein n=1 Tax=Nitrosopumilus sp. TaxID=2024843 RepID=UPI00247DD691|nr:polysaccharide biosynthesis protein [Nitrosopumilus sp.]MCV0393566.1 polysaccharide biosynthesis protein [Nitrosopumilus sp.]